MTTLMTMEVNKVYHELFSAQLSFYKVNADGKKELKRTSKLPHYATLGKPFPRLSEVAYFFDEAERAYHAKEHLVLTLELRVHAYLPARNGTEPELKVSKGIVKYVVPQDVRVTSAISNLIRNQFALLAEINNYTRVERTHVLDNFVYSGVYMKQIDHLLRDQEVEVYQIHDLAPRTKEGRFAECSNEQPTN